MSTVLDVSDDWPAGDKGSCWSLSGWRWRGLSRGWGTSFRPNWCRQSQGCAWALWRSINVERRETRAAATRGLQLRAGFVFRIRFTFITTIVIIIASQQCPGNVYSVCIDIAHGYSTR